MSAKNRKSLTCKTMNQQIFSTEKFANFTNFTNEEFVGYWDGRSKKFAPGQSLYMPDYLAKHFAKHLVNKELLKTDGSGNLVYKDGDKMTSPKFPEQVPLFMKLFNQAYTPDESEPDAQNAKEDLDAIIDKANKKKTINKEPQDPTQPQVILPPEDDEEESEEESFEGKPVE